MEIRWVAGSTNSSVTRSKMAMCLSTEAPNSVAGVLLHGPAIVDVVEEMGIVIGATKVRPRYGLVEALVTGRQFSWSTYSVDRTQPIMEARPRIQRSQLICNKVSSQLCDL